MYIVIHLRYPPGTIPLTKARPNASDKARRDISGILRRSLKFRELIHLVSYSVIYKGIRIRPLLNRALSGRIMPIATFLEFKGDP